MSIQWATNTSVSMTQGKRDSTRTTAARRHALEKRDKELAVVWALEQKLGIEHRWDSSCAEWQETAHLVVRHKYQRALDTLEGLAVARMFELTKMNRSQTGQ